jgi:hypothetical protein
MIDMKSDITGVKQAIGALKKIDPEYRKDFNRDAKAIAAPLVSAAKSAYPTIPLSGMSKTWLQSERTIFPWEISKVRSGVKLKTSTRKNTSSVLYITQSNPAGAIFEVAGKANAGSKFNKNLRAKSGFILWPTADKYLPEVHDGLVKLIDGVMATIKRDMP